MAIRALDVTKTYGPAANPVHALRGRIWKQRHGHQHGKGRGIGSHGCRAGESPACRH